MITRKPPRPDELTDLRILDELDRDPALSQREISRRVGVSLGLTNLILKRMARKAWIKLRTVPGRRMLYALTPRGMGEKLRKTKDFLGLSLRYYRELRTTLVRQIRESGCRPPRVATYGAGELSTLAAEAAREAGGRFLGPIEEEGEARRANVIVLISTPPRSRQEAWARAGFCLIDLS